MDMYIVRPGGIVYKADDVLEWDRWQEYTYGDYMKPFMEGGMRVGWDDLTQEEGGGYVSTVFLGLNHSWFPCGQPILFETMILNNNTEFDQSQWRWHTYEEALEGHRRAVLYAKGQLSVNEVDRHTVVDGTPFLQE